MARRADSFLMKVAAAGGSETAMQTAFWFFGFLGLPAPCLNPPVRIGLLNLFDEDHQDVHSENVLL